MEAKIGPLEKEDKKRMASIEMKVLRRTPGTSFLTTKGMTKFWKS
jgi:hypothetical protein